MNERLTLACVGKTFGRHRALIDISLTFDPGEVAVVLGPNGAGKTTLLGVLSTLVAPSTGTLTFGAEALSRNSPLRAKIGWVGHEPGIYGDLTASENLETFAALYAVRANVAELLDRVGLSEVRREVPVRTFSRGMQQRLALARALLHGPQILLFDEPGSALDPAGVAWLTTQIARERAAGRLVIVVTHDLSAAATLASHLVILRRGRVVFDEHRERFDDVRALYEEKTGAVR